MLLHGLDDDDVHLCVLGLAQQRVEPATQVLRAVDLGEEQHLVGRPGRADEGDPTVVRDEALTREVDLPYGEGTDHAEGIGLLADGSLLVVYDSPSPERLRDGAVLADVVRLG